MYYVSSTFSYLHVTLCLLELGGVLNQLSMIIELLVLTMPHLNLASYNFQLNVPIILAIHKSIQRIGSDLWDLSIQWTSLNWAVDVVAGGPLVNFA